MSWKGRKGNSTEHKTARACNGVSQTLIKHIYSCTNTVLKLIYRGPPLLSSPFLQASPLLLSLCFHCIFVMLYELIPFAFCPCVLLVFPFFPVFGFCNIFALQKKSGRIGREELIPLSLSHSCPYGWIQTVCRRKIGKPELGYVGDPHEDRRPFSEPKCSGCVAGDRSQ